MFSMLDILIILCNTSLKLFNLKELKEIANMYYLIIILLNQKKLYDNIINIIKIIISSLKLIYINFVCIINIYVLFIIIFFQFFLYS
jgi:hypothetical protein